MKNISFALIGLFVAGTVWAQTSGSSTPVSFRIEKEVVPPMLQMVSGSLKFADANGNKFINANEQCAISMKICNVGKGDAFGCTAKIEGSGTTAGLSFGNQRLPIIHPNETIDVKFPIKASMETVSGNVQFVVQVLEPNGFGVDPAQITVATRKFEAPFVEIVSYKIVSSGGGKLLKKQPFRVQVLMQNTDIGLAKNVTMQFAVPTNMFLLDGEKYQTFASLAPNEQKMLEFEFQTNSGVADELDLEIKLSESYGKYAKDAHIPLRFGQAVSSGMTSLQVQGEDKQINITRGSLVADVDENIPQTDKKNTNTFVIIIANENYQQVASVPFALNDGKVFRQYCEQTLGIPAKNINYQPNATGGQIQAQIDWIRMRAEVLDNPNIIVYYAGHGIPDEASKTAYLIPTDGIINNLKTCIKLDDLYAAFGEMPTGNVTVFMDACFSGSKREQGMLASARGVALKARPGQPKGNMVVFSAAQGDETAYPYTTKQHGMFTYYLLKKLQDTKGDVTLQDLGNYITSEVKKQSVLENNKLQTPCVTPASAVADSWQKWKLK